MTKETALTRETGLTDSREAALWKALGLDRAQPEQRELALSIAKRYDLDPMLRHLVLIDGKPFITRDGLLWVAHRSGQFDGISVTKPTVVDGYWDCLATVWRKDMSHSFEYAGRYPTSGGNQKFAPEMAIKVAESMALRRAFNVAAPAVEERWDVDVPAEPAAPQPTLAERAAARRAEVEEAPLVDERRGVPVEYADAPDNRAAEAIQEWAEGEVAAAPPLLLSKPAFIARLKENGISADHAGTVRLALFPDPSHELDDADRGVLWLQLAAEKEAQEAVPA